MGFWTYEMAANTDSAKEREFRASIGMKEMDHGWAKLTEGWYANW